MTCKEEGYGFNNKKIHEGEGTVSGYNQNHIFCSGKLKMIIGH
jgi:hypothetical protein